MDASSESCQRALNTQSKEGSSPMMSTVQVPQGAIFKIVVLNDFGSTPSWIFQGFPPPLVQKSYVGNIQIQHQPTPLSAKQLPINQPHFGLSKIWSHHKKSLRIPLIALITHDGSLNLDIQYVGMAVRTESISVSLPSQL